jgi:hypothetical protein
MAVFDHQLADFEGFAAKVAQLFRGYFRLVVKGWKKSVEVDYACESCGIKPVKDSDKRYWHTHHRNGDKTNNKPSDLECLCVLCHSYKDHMHEENLDKARMKIELDSFVNRYREELGCQVITSLAWNPI